MLVGGIGEELAPVDTLPQSLPMVVACMGEGVSTPWAYGTLDSQYSNFDPPRDAKDMAAKFSKALKEKDTAFICSSCYNLFEPVVEAARPAVGAIKRVMNLSGARLSMMSGSGPSVFGIFSSLEDADAACRALRDMGASAFVCHPMGEAL